MDHVIVTPGTRRGALLAPSRSLGAFVSVAAFVSTFLAGCAFASPPAQAPSRGPAAVSVGPDPVIHVVIGLGGLSAWNRNCAPVRVDVTGGTRAFDGVLHLRCGSQVTRSQFEIPLSAEPGARRRLNVVACALGAGACEWSLDGSTWSNTNLTALTAPGAPIIAVVGPDIGRVLRIEQALGGTPGMYPTPQPADSTRTAVLMPDEVPLEASGWAQAPLVVLDSRDAPLLAREGVLALRDHVRAGATLVVSGPELASVPETLRLATDSGTTTVLVPQEDGTDVSLTAWQLVPEAAASAVAWAGEERPWILSKRLGAGRLVTLGLDLRDATTREALPPTAWLAMAGLTQAAMTPQSIGEPAWASSVQGVLKREEAMAAGQGLVPPSVAGVYLILAGIVLLVASWLLARRSAGSARRRDIALLLAALAAPGFLVGALRKGARPMTTTVAEYWPADGRARSLTWTSVTHDGTTMLPEGVATVIAIGGTLGRAPPQSTMRLGASPAVTIDVLPRLAWVFVLTDRWSGVPAAEFQALRFEGHALRLEGGSLSGGHPVTGTAPAFLGEIAQAAATGGVRDGRVYLLASSSADQRVVWIVREDLP